MRHNLSIPRGYIPPRHRYPISAPKPRESNTEAIYRFIVFLVGGIGGMAFGAWLVHTLRGVA